MRRHRRAGMRDEMRVEAGLVYLDDLRDTGVGRRAGGDDGGRPRRPQDADRQEGGWRRGTRIVSAPTRSSSPKVT